jgi:hypothetical protein
MKHHAAGLRSLHGRSEGENQFAPQQAIYRLRKLSISTFLHTVNAPLTRVTPVSPG